MNRTCLRYARVAMWLLAGALAGLAQNICIESGPYYSAWSCLVSGTVSNYGVLNWTNLNVCVGEPITGPVLVTNFVFNSGKAERQVTFSCPEHPAYWLTNTIRYITGPVYFTPSIPGTLTNVGTNTYTANVESRPTSLIGWWRAEDDALDALGLNNGSLQGGATFATGKVARAFSFSSISDSVRVPASVSLNAGVGTGLTIEAWINPADFTNRHFIAEWNDGAGGIGAHFGLLASNEFSLGPGNMWMNLRDIHGGDHLLTAPGGTLTNNQFQHVAITYDQTTGQAKIYCNGSVVSSNNLGVFTPQMTYDFYIGRRVSGDAILSFRGKIDELAVYSRALTQSEIQAIYNADSAGKCFNNLPAGCATLPSDAVCNTITTLVATVTIKAWDCSSTYCFEPPAGSIVGWWRGESNALDAVFTNHATTNGSLSYTNGRVGTGFALNGSNAWLRVPANSNLNVGLGSGLTFETWVNLAGASTNSFPIIEYHTGTNFGPGIWKASNGAVYVNLVETNGTSHEFYTPAGLLAGGLYQHVALTYDRTNACVYVDGTRVVQTNLGNLQLRTGLDIHLGARTNTGKFFQGRLDEPTLYRVALTSNQIYSAYRALTLGKCANDDPDGDGLTNLQEIRNGTDPLTATLQLTSPTNGAVFNTGTNIVLAATITDTNAQVAQVQFFANGTNLGTDTTAPYGVTWSNAPLGSFGLTAVATLNSGDKSTSSVVNISVVGEVFVLGVNLGRPAASVVIFGNRWWGYDEAVSNGMTAGHNPQWEHPGPYSFSFSPPVGTNINEMFQSKVCRFENDFKNNTNDFQGFTLRQPVSNATYHVYLWSMENYLTHFRSIDIKLEGVTVATAIGDKLLGQWERYGPYTATVTDTNLDVEVLRHGKGDPALFGIEVYRLAPTNSPATNLSPTVTLTTPTNNSKFSSPAAVVLTADATDPDGTISKVEFFKGSTKLGETTNYPYAFLWTPVTNGTYVLKARATDNQGATADSSTVTIYVGSRPTIVLTAPTNGAWFTNGANIPVSATANDPDGTITAVQFFAETNSLGTDTNSPYSIVWSNASSGRYEVYAKAKDNDGHVAFSSNIVIHVNGAPLVDAGSNQTVWLSTNGRVNVQLTGRVVDDGYLRGTNGNPSLSVSWSVISAPTTNSSVSFTNQTEPATQATFTNAGQYVLQLSADDGQYSVSSRVTNTVNPANQPPVVNAGTNFTLVLSATNSFYARTTNFVPITIGIRSPIGIDYQPGSNRLLVSVNHSNFGLPYNFEAVSATGRRSQFSPISGWTDELKIATAKDTNGGFAVGEFFTGTGEPGEIARISPDGLTNTAPWVTLTNSTITTNAGTLRGSLYVDRTGVWGGDLIAVTTMGHVWRISSSGVATNLCSITNGDNPVHLEGLCTIPNDTNKYGDWAGKILIGAEVESAFYTVSTNLEVREFTNWLASDGGFAGLRPEDIDLIPTNQNFFGVDFGNDRLLGASASAFRGMEGDILVVEEASALVWRVYWETNTLKAQQLFTNGESAGQWEHVTFAPMPLATIGIPRPLLSGAVSDDGLPVGITNIQWSKVSGPGVAAFTNGSSPLTGVSFTEPGIYTLRLAADDTELTNSATVTVTVLQNQSPVVDAGVEQKIFMVSNSVSAHLAGHATDDGLPGHYYGVPDGYLDYHWSWINTNAFGEDVEVEFSDPNDPHTTVKFHQVGTYLLRLTVGDGEAIGLAETTVTVSPQIPPQIVITAPKSQSVFYSEPGGIDVELNWTNFIPEGVTVNYVDLFDTSYYDYPNPFDSAGPDTTNSTGSFSDGVHTVTAQITYILTNDPGTDLYATSAPVTFYVNMAALIVTNLGGSPIMGCPSPTNTNQTVAVVLFGDDGSPRTNETVTFQVSGANTTNGTAVTDSQGAAWFTYFGTNAGMDRIVLSSSVATNDDVYRLWATGIPCAGTIYGALTTNSPFSTGDRTGSRSRRADYYSFHGTNNQTVAITMRSTNYDTRLYLWKECDVVMQSQDSRGRYAQIVHNLAGDGDYVIEATSFEAETNGAYVLQFACDFTVGTNGNAAPLLSVAVDGLTVTNFATVDFGITEIGNVVDRLITISNLSNAMLQIWGLGDDTNFVPRSSPVGALPPSNSTSFVLRYLARTNEVTNGTLIIYSSDTNHSPFVLNLHGVANRSGGAPIVYLNSPMQGAKYGRPDYIPIAARAIAQTGAVQSVEFFADDLSISRFTNNPTAPSFLWPDASAGTHVLRATATDSAGRVATSHPVTVQVQTFTNYYPPVANLDLYTFYGGSGNVVLDVLANDQVSPDGGSLRITSVTPSGRAAVSIVSNGLALRYSVPQQISLYGLDQVIYTIKDSRGGTATAMVKVWLDDPRPPHIQLTNPVPGAGFAASNPITMKALLTAPLANVTKVEFFADRQLLGTISNPGNGSLTNIWSNAIATWGSLNRTLRVKATDLIGQTAEDEVTVAITNRPGNSPPVAALSNPGIYVTPDDMGLGRIPVVRDGFLDVYGTARDSDDSVSYQVRLYSTDGALLRDLTPPSLNAWGYHNGAVTNGILCKADFSGLPNATYDLELVVRGGYEETNAIVRFALSTDLKIGQFSFSQQDLTIPVNGIPLTIIRTYNSLNPNVGDFGASWTLSLMDMDVQLDEDRDWVDDLGDEGDGSFFSVRTGGGRDVTLTLPDGRRTTFFFGVGSINGGLQYEAKWNPPPGITAKLSLPPSVSSTINILGTSGGIGGPAWAANPMTSFESFDIPGFVLTTQDGTEFRIAREDLREHAFLDDDYTEQFVHTYGPPYLSSIVQRSGDEIRISKQSIDHYQGGTNKTRSVLIQRNGSGQIVAISDPLGGTNGPAAVKYDYDGDGNLSKVYRLKDRTANGTNGVYEVTSYFYTNANFPHYLTDIIDPRGIRVARTLYDDDGKMIGMVDAAGRTNRFVHDPTNKVETVYDRLGNPTSYAYDSRGNVTNSLNAAGQSMAYAYDDQNNKTNEIVLRNGAPYATNQFQFDANGFLTTSVNPLGHTNLFTYDATGRLLTSADALGRTSTNFYDTAGNLIGTADALGNASTNAYANGLLIESRDALSTRTTNGYDAVGNLANTVTLWLSNGTWVLLASNSFAYDDNGNRTNQAVRRTTSQGVVSEVTTYVYDAMNRLVATIDPLGRTNPVVYNELGKQELTFDKLGHGTHYEYDALGRMFQVTHPDQTWESYVFDEEGRRIAVTNRAGYVTQYQYDAVGRMTNTIHPDGATARSIYDEVGRVRLTVDARGVTNAFGYDVGGRRIAVTNAWGTSTAVTNYFGYDVNGNQPWVTNALGRVTTNVFDTLNRLVEVRHADGTTNRTEFDVLGRRVAEVDAAGIRTQFGYDGAGRLITVTNAVGKSEQMVTSYRYDDAGNQVAQVDGLGRTNRYEYDALGRRIKRVLPGGQTETFGYDPIGNLLRHTNFNGVVLTNTYDEMNRLVTRTGPSGVLASFIYTPTGQRAQMTDLSGVTAYHYDLRDRLASTVTPQGTLNYSYDANGSLLTTASDTPGGLNLHYGYDSLNRVTNAMENGSGASLSAGYGFDAVGNLQRVSYGNGVTNLYQFDAMNRLTSVVWKTNGGTIASFGYTLGSTGNRTGLAETNNAAARTFAWQYDALYRLTNEVLSGATTGAAGYRYDLVGNRTNRDSTVSGLTNQSFAYSTNDWLTTDVYDNNGNTRTNGSNVYLYDELNRLTNANAGAVTIVYDGDGNRVRKTVGGVTTLFLVDSRNPSGYAQVVEEKTVSGGLTNLGRVYSYGLDLVCQRQVTNGAAHYFGYDGHGSTRFLTGTNGGVTDTYVYDAYGTLIASTGSTPNRYLYAGEQFDSDLGLYYLRARYLNPNTGRFWSMDSFEGTTEDPLSLHKFVYVSGNPVMLTDPSGHDGDLGSLMVSTSIGSSLDSVYNGVVSTTGNSVQNQIMYGGNAGIYSILLDAGFLVGGQILMKVVEGSSIAISKIASGFAVKQELSAFTFAANYGILPCKMLYKIRDSGKMVGGTQIHHLIEKRFVEEGRILKGVKAGDIPGIVLTPAEHDVFTQAWKSRIGYDKSGAQITSSTATIDDIWNAAKSIYANYPDLLEYCRVFLGK